MSGHDRQKLHDKAESQLGLISRQQLAELGVANDFLDRRLREKNWSRVIRGVYRIGAGQLTTTVMELALFLRAGDGAVLSHHSAARKQRLDVPWDKKVYLTLPRARRVPDIPGTVIHRSRDLLAAEVVDLGPLRVTRLGRTIVDLASVVDHRWLRAAVDSALRRSFKNLDLIKAAAQRAGRGHSGAARLGELLATYTAEANLPASALESLSMELGLATGRKPHLHHWEHDVGFQAEIDFAWPEERVAVLLDGYAFHSSRRAFHRDRLVTFRLRSMGWDVSRFSWDQMVGQRQEVIDQVASVVLARRAHPPPPHAYVAPRGAPPPGVIEAALSGAFIRHD